MDNSLKTFISLVMNENLVQAQSLIKEKLNEGTTTFTIINPISNPHF